MATPRRMGSENSETRRLLLDVTERLMLDEGYAAVGVRRVAREAGVTPGLVLYYFRTLDDLFLAALRRRADEQLERQARLLEEHQPLRALWELNGLPANALTTEFLALGNHRKAIRTELAVHAERYRKALERTVAEAAANDPGSLPDVSPAALVVLTTAVSRVLGMENAMGLTYGHRETLALVEKLLERHGGVPSSEAP